MEIKECKNSSGKIFGTITIKDDEIIINNQSKPELIINNKVLIDKIKNNDTSVLIELFDEYFLNIGEIAALYQKPYSTIRKLLNSMNPKTGQNSGRRNSSYGRKHSEETKRKIGEKSKGRKIPQYERTPEIREKISQGLKKYYATHKVSEETRAKLS